MGLSCDMENIQSTKTFVLKTRHQITITQGRAFSGTAYAARMDERGHTETEYNYKPQSDAPTQTDTKTKDSVEQRNDR